MFGLLTFSQVEDRRSITAFMELLFIFISTTSTGHFTVSEEDRYICCLEALCMSFQSYDGHAYTQWSLMMVREHKVLVKSIGISKRH